MLVLFYQQTLANKMQKAVYSKIWDR